MALSYSSLCDDFCMDCCLTTELDLPTSRETLLNFFERVQRGFPNMARIHRRDENELVLEEDRESGSFRWLSVESRRLVGGHVNPDSLADAYDFHATVLELAPSYLTVSRLDTLHLDVLFGFDFTYTGNHDEIVAEALLNGSPLSGLLDGSGLRLLDCEPLMVMALDDACRLQARLSVQTRTTTQQVRTGDYRGDEISVYFTVRQFWGPDQRDSFDATFRRLGAITEDLVNRKIIPRVLTPISQAIATRG